ncbi:hypothetical protein F4604DRAFT_1915625 [Suillus subluteus]|nr:hypothetical protein F4604DRAFT_1915625 [Suillus subluteus]
MSNSSSVGSVHSLRSRGSTMVDEPMGLQDNTASRKLATHWELEEESELIAFLATHKAEAGDNTTFKNSVYSDASKHLNALYPIYRDAAKSQSSCKTKWNNLKKSYNVIKDIKLLSGFVWSDEHGAGVTPETSGAWDAHAKAHPLSKPFPHKGFPHYAAVEALMPSTTKGKFVTRQPPARRVPSVPMAASSSSLMPPPSTTPIRTCHILPSPSASTSNSMDLLILADAATAIAEAGPQTSPAAPTSTFTPTTSDSRLTSASRGKHKHSALDNTESSRKHSHPPSLAAKAQQEGSAALASIAQVLLQVVDSFSSSSSTQQDERPPPMTLGCAITALCDTEGLQLDDVLVLTDFMTANPNEVVAFLALKEGPVWRTSWAQRKLAALRGNAR